MHLLHLDFKGAAPSARRVADYLAYFRDCGFEGVVFEFDCRLPWRAWPQAGRPLYTMDEAAAIVSRCRQLGMEAIPLVQTLGHLEWVLTDPAYAALREAGSLAEACPANPEVGERLRAWIDEALALFDHPNRIHLGADEAYVMGECPQCRARAEASPLGRTGLYLDHVGSLCRHAAARGARPMIWGDMLKPVANSDAYAVFPKGTVVFNWSYYGLPPSETAPWKSAAIAAGLEVWGASAVMCSFSGQSLSLLPDYLGRLKNVLSWHQAEGNVLHTTWGRPSNTWPLYCPWPALVSLFAAAGGGEGAWAGHPWREILPLLGDGEHFLVPRRLSAAQAAVEAVPARHAVERESKRYILLALRYQELLRRHLELRAQERAMGHTAAVVGRDGDALKRHILKPLEENGRLFDQWCGEMRAFFADNELADADEFLAERRAALL